MKNFPYSDDRCHLCNELKREDGYCSCAESWRNPRPVSDFLSNTSEQGEGKEEFHGIEIKYSCVCNTIEERDLFIDFIAAMKKLKEK